MKKRVIAISVLVVVVAVGITAAALYYGRDGDAPPVSGAVQNFTVATEAVPAPDIGILDAQGNTVTLERYRGKLVVVNFWATWCGPCVRELPSLQRLATALSANDGRVVLISQDRGGFDQITPFLGKLKIDIADSYVDEKLRFSRAAGVISLPTTILFGSDGREIGRLVGHADWDSPEALALIRHFLP